MSGLSAGPNKDIIIYIFTPLWVTAVGHSWWCNVRMQLIILHPNYPW